MTQPYKTISKNSIMQSAKLTFERWLAIESLKIVYGRKSNVAANDNERPNLIA